MPSAVEVGVVLKAFVSACLIDWMHFKYGVLVQEHNQIIHGRPFLFVGSGCQVGVLGDAGNPAVPCR